MSYAADKQTGRQTDKQTDPNILPTATDRGRREYAKQIIMNQTKREYRPINAE